MRSSVELRREAAVILRQLISGKKQLECQRLFGGDQWVLVNKPNGKKRTVIDTEMIKAMCTANWLVIEGGVLAKPTPAGLGLAGVAPAQDDFARQHQTRSTKRVKIDGGPTITALTNESESPLSWLRSRKGRDGKRLIDWHEFEAGERLARDFTFAGMSPRITASWDFSQPATSTKRRGPSTLEITEKAIAARERFHAALDSLGPELAAVAFEICCLGNGLEKVERQLAWPRRSAKLVLKIALARLAEHYGIGPTANTQRSTIGQWNQMGYRPRVLTAEEWAKVNA